MKQNTASFRFYQELNDFLPLYNKKQQFTYSFKSNPSIKDAIEALGVPHTEVDLILVNGTAVDFSCRLRQGDRVSVYPVFESFDVSHVTRLRKQPLRNSRFILDVHLGKLARDLRMFGFDTLYENDYDDPEIVRLGVEEQRIILTRDIGILKHSDVTHGYWVRSTHPEEQLIEVMQRFDLYCQCRPLTRCIVCNGPIETVSKNEIHQRLLPRTKKFYSEFFFCRRCDRIYWKGSHYIKMSEKIRDTLKSISTAEKKN